MSSLIRAVIDVGTNSVKVLVAEVRGRTVIPLFEKSHQTRLGSGFYSSHRLKPESIDQTARAVSDFAAEAATFRPESTRVIATSAARDAVNQSDLVRAIQDQSGLPVEVLSGHQEAEWVFQGVSSDPELDGHPLLIADVGGGSSELILGQDSVHCFRDSFRLGTVRLLDHIAPADPPAPSDWSRCHGLVAETVANQIVPALRCHWPNLDKSRLLFVGTGGVASILARVQFCLSTFDRGQIDRAVLSLGQVRQLRERFWSLNLSERTRIVGLPANRADVILTGAAIFETVMEQAALPELRVSTRGIRFAALLDTLQSDPSHVP